MKAENINIVKLNEDIENIKKSLAQSNKLVELCFEQNQYIDYARNKMHSDNLHKMLGIMNELRSRHELDRQMRGG